MRVERIGITQNYNKSNKQNFTARFPKKEIIQIIKDSKQEYGAAAVPMLDILFGLLDKFPGKVAHIKKTPPDRDIYYGHFNSKELLIDNKVIDRTNEYVLNILFLKDLLVGKNYRDDFIPMPERIFEQKWFEHGARNEDSLLSYALPEPVKRVKKTVKPQSKPVDWRADGVVSPEPEVARLNRNVKLIKPYSVVKEIYKDQKGRNVHISNIDILAKSKTEEGIAELDAIEQSLNENFKPIFAQKRVAARLEIEKLNQNKKHR